MTTNLQQSPFLQTQRDFPGDNPKSLAVQVDKSFIEIAQAVNTRAIGNYAIGVNIVNGKTYYFNGSSSSQSGLQRVYTFSATGNIPHGIQWASVSSISPGSYGSFTDGTNWYGCPYGSSVAVAGQVSFSVTPTNIVVIAGAGAPSIINGIIILDWISTV
jgi:hypothetical protein